MRNTRTSKTCTYCHTAPLNVPLGVSTSRDWKVYQNMVHFTMHLLRHIYTRLEEACLNVVASCTCILPCDPAQSGGHTKLQRMHISLFDPLTAQCPTTDRLTGDCLTGDRLTGDCMTADGPTADCLTADGPTADCLIVRRCRDLTIHHLTSWDSLL